MKEYEEIEQKIEKELEMIKCPPFVKVFQAINSEQVDKKKESKRKRSKIFSQIVALASCLLILFIGYLIYDIYRNQPDETEGVRYVDADVITVDGDLNDILSLTDIYLPDFSVLSNIIVEKGEHKETGATVYFRVKGVCETQEDFREVILKIILQKNYEQVKEEEYIGEKFLIVSNKLIGYTDKGYLDPFYNYKISFSDKGVRYLFDYQTITQNDVGDFLQLFLPA